MNDREFREREELLDRAIAEMLAERDRADGPRSRPRAGDDRVEADVEAFLDDEAWFRRETRPLTLAGADTGREPALLAAGERVGPYEIVEPLGSGGMGTVYRAEHAVLRRRVALKVLSDHLLSDPAFVQRFEREGRALAQLRHPHVVAVHDIGRDGDRPWLAMELVDGVSLRELIDARSLSPPQALGLVPKICAALEYAHDQGIVHRDVKPENILIDRAGEPKVADFGLARMVHGDEPDDGLTRTDMLIGTRSYMAPEQWQTAKVDHRADVYSLGVVVYEMLTGDLPVGAYPPPSVNRAVGSAVDDLVLKALDRDPDSRWQSAAALGAAVEESFVKSRPRGQVLVVRDLRTGEAMGSSPVHRLRVTMSDDEALTLCGWDRAEIGVEANEDEDWQCEADEAGIRLTFGEEVTLSVPRGVEIDLQVAEAPVFARDLESDLVVWTGTERVNVARHRGALRIQRTGAGDVDVRGLHSHDVDVRTDSGSVLVTELVQDRGDVRVQTTSGAIDVQVIPEACALAFEASSVSGEVTVDEDWEEVSRDQRHVQTGRLGSGRGRLRLCSSSAAVSLKTFDEPPSTPQRIRQHWWSWMLWALGAWLIWKILF